MFVHILPAVLRHGRGGGAALSGDAYIILAGAALLLAAVGRHKFSVHVRLWSL
jgi:hypothetical protein